MPPKKTQAARSVAQDEGSLLHGISNDGRRGISSHFRCGKDSGLWLSA